MIWSDPTAEECCNDGSETEPIAEGRTGYER